VFIALAAFAVRRSCRCSSQQGATRFVIRCSAFGLFATSLNLLVGYTGMVSFGHGMFFGLGAYGFGLIMQRTGLPVPVAFVATLVITTLIAAVIGAICVRLKEIYFAFVTLGSDADPQHDFVLGVPDRRRPGPARRHSAPAFFGIDLSNHVHLYITSCALLVIGLLLMRQIAQSPFGYTLRMIRDNASRASFVASMSGAQNSRSSYWRRRSPRRRHHHGAVRVGAYPEFAYMGRTSCARGIFINMPSSRRLVPGRQFGIGARHETAP